MKIYKFQLVMDEQDNFKLQDKSIHNLPLESFVEGYSFHNACVSFLKENNLTEIVDYNEETIEVIYINGVNGMACKYKASIIN